MTEAGRVAALWRYPVKSMAAERLDEIEVSWAGLAGDRRWAFVRGGIERSGFPWMTIRERSNMGHYRPSFVDPSRPDTSRTVVRTPTGDELEVVDPALAAELGEGVRVIKQDRGVFDAMPLSLVSTQSVAALGALVGSELDPLRFRSNLLIDAAGDEPFQEEAWVGSMLRIGGVRMRVDQQDERCVIINVDPATTERDPAVLRTLARERQTCIGVYGSTVAPGVVAVGDAVVVEA
ncbi:MAG: MOSC domain-containing protein [Solirubrobacteraceae bacterium]